MWCKPLLLKRYMKELTTDTNKVGLSTKGIPKYVFIQVFIIRVLICIQD